MVSNSALAAVCVRTGLHAYLLYESYALGNSIQSYAEQLETRRQEEHQKAVRDGRPPGQYWLDMEPPKVCLQLVPEQNVPEQNELTHDYRSFLML